MITLRNMFNRRTLPNLVAGVIIVLMVPWLYWAIVDRQPVASSVSEIISKEVRQGDFLQIDYDVTWVSRCEIVAFRYIIDEMQVEWPISAQQRVVEAGRQQFSIRVPVPMAASPGAALYRGTLRYVCNPWQRFFPLEQDLQERQFTIIQNESLTWRRREGTYEAPPFIRRFAGLKPASQPVPTAPQQVASIEPKECLVMGNIRRDGDKVFHDKDSPYRSLVKPEICFTTRDEARVAGFRPPR